MYVLHCICLIRPASIYCVDWPIESLVLPPPAVCWDASRCECNRERKHSPRLSLSRLASRQSGLDSRGRRAVCAACSANMALAQGPSRCFVWCCVGVVLVLSYAVSPSWGSGPHGVQQALPNVMPFREIEYSPPVLINDYKSPVRFDAKGMGNLYNFTKMFMRIIQREEPYPQGESHFQVFQIIPKDGFRNPVALSRDQLAVGVLPTPVSLVALE